MGLPQVRYKAAEVIRRAGIEAPPVDPEAAIALWPGLRLALDDLDVPGVLVNFGVHGGEIILRRADRPTRQRFTAAHELGHWVLTQGAHVGRMDSYRGLERWCDQFAAELLMPKEWIVDDVSGMSWGSLARKIDLMPGRYGVSRQSMFLRLAEVCDVSILERVRRKGNWNWEGSYPVSGVSARWLKESLLYYEQRPACSKLSGMSGAITTWRKRISGELWEVIAFSPSERA